MSNVFDKVSPTSSLHTLRTIYQAVYTFRIRNKRLNLNNMRNTKEKAIALSSKLSETLDDKKGEFTFTFFDNTKIAVRVLNMTSTTDANGFNCFITTFTNDINQTTRYDIYNIKDIK